MSAVTFTATELDLTDQVIVTESADLLDAAALTAAADALLAADAAARLAQQQTDAESVAPAEIPQPRRARRRQPLDLSPERRAEREEMMVKNLPLVRYVANAMSRHAGQSVLLDYDDMLSYGTEGLIAAVDTFDAERGLKFSTWAVMHIRTTIQDALRTLDPLPRSVRAKGKEIDRVSANLAHAHGRWPEQAEIAAALGQPIEQLRRTMDSLAHSIVSLEQVDGGHDGASTSGDEGGYSMLNLLADDDPTTSPAESLERTEMSRLLRAAIAALPPREEVLIDAHYRQGQSMRQVSYLLGISESRVSQLHARAVRLLREHMNQALSIDPAPTNRRGPRSLSTSTDRRSAPRRAARAA